ncbi:MAG: PHP domain-containing protein, partial [Spirochaetales bacterium]|nr:PHP domain-containing protein [Spirochaetales bacterium]
MLKTNYHTHYSICDGRGWAEEYVLAALERGFDVLGFSSHAPLPFPSGWTMAAEDFPVYCAEVRRLRELYAGSLEIYLGLEIDFIS